MLLVILGLSLFLIGALGLALDGGQMYAHRQMAQTAADAAAEAGIMSIFAGTNATSASPFGTGSPPAAFTCSIADGRTPCVYARSNGFGGSASDTVSIDFPTTIAGVPLSSDPVPAIRVTVTRTLNTGLIRFIGPSTTSVTGIAVAAIVFQSNRVPLLITHPTFPSTLTNGSALLKVCGGPPVSIQVNSSNAAAVSISKVVDLSHAGPNDPGDCTTGTGGDFAVTGGPTNAPGNSESGHHRPLRPAVRAAARSLREPSRAGHSAPRAPPRSSSESGCPAAQCTLYSPGLYTNLIVKNDTALFKPGLYYISGGQGFGNAANGNMLMATGYPADPNTGSGMVVYNTGTGIFNIGANSNAHLVGADNKSFYQGILFFEDRNAVALTHSLGGGGSIILTGTLYMTNSLTRHAESAEPVPDPESGRERGDSAQRIDCGGRSDHGRDLLCHFQPGRGPSLTTRRAGLVR